MVSVISWLFLFVFAFIKPSLDTTRSLLHLSLDNFLVALFWVVVQLLIGVFVCSTLRVLKFDKEKSVLLAMVSTFVLWNAFVWTSHIPFIIGH